MQFSIMSRRNFACSLGALPFFAGAPALPSAAATYVSDAPGEIFVSRIDEEQSMLAPKAEIQDVEVDPDYPENTILVYQKELVIRHIRTRGLARQYPVGLGRAGLEFEGEAVVARKAVWPSWRPTDEMIARSPEHYARYSDGVPGGPGNPLGSRALYLYRNGADTFYRIHGTDSPETVGTYVSNGCVRMINAHIEALYDLVDIGTVVRVV